MNHKQMIIYQFQIIEFIHIALLNIKQKYLVEFHYY